jgi:hypothetical protein
MTLVPNAELILWDAFSTYFNTSGSLGVTAASTPWASISGPATIGEWATGRFAIYNMGTLTSKSLLGNATTFGGGFRIPVTEIGNTASILSFLDGASATQMFLRKNPDGSISAVRGATVLGTSAIVLNSSQDHYIGFEVKIDDATGYVKIWVDQVATSSPVLSLTGVDTKNTANTGASFVAYAPGNNSSFNAALSDLYLTNGTYYGTKRGYQKLPNSDIQAQFTPSTAGANFEMVNDRHTVADYVQGSVGSIDVYGLTGIPANANVIDSVRVSFSGNKTDTAGRTARAGVKSGASTFYTDALNLPATAQYEGKATNLDPATGLPWTLTSINALTATIEAVS